MSRMTLYYDYTTPEQLLQRLELFDSPDKFTLVLYGIFRHTLQAKQLSDIIKTQQTFSQGRKVIFKNHIVLLGDCKISSAAKKVLAANSFCVEFPLGKAYEQKAPEVLPQIRKLTQAGIPARAWFDELQDQQGVYARYSQMGMSVYFYDPQYTDGREQWFDAWLRDPRATEVNVFTDIIYMLTLRLRPHNCRHGSCLGNTFYAAADGEMYMCPLHIGQATRLSQGSEKSMKELFSAEGVYQTVRTAVEKREGCVDTCPEFPYCQGGCPLQERCREQDQNYLALVRTVQQSLKTVYESADLDSVNYIVKNAILNAVAFGTAFL